MTAVTWGTVPDWLAAVGTVGALVAGLVLLRRQLSEYALSARERRATQASLILGWTVPPAKDEPQQAAVVVVRNASPSPVYKLMAFLRDESGDMRIVWASSPVGPSVERRIVVKFGHQHEPAAADIIELEFTDGSGLTWRRDTDGTLTEVSSEKARWLSMAVPMLSPATQPLDES